MRYPTLPYPTLLYPNLFSTSFICIPISTITLLSVTLVHPYYPTFQLIHEVTGGPKSDSKPITVETSRKLPPDHCWRIIELGEGQIGFQNMHDRGYLVMKKGVYAHYVGTSRTLVPQCAFTPSIGPYFVRRDKGKINTPSRLSSNIHSILIHLYYATPSKECYRWIWTTRDMSTQPAPRAVLL